MHVFHIIIVLSIMVFLDCSAALNIKCIALNPSHLLQNFMLDSSKAKLS